MLNSWFSVLTYNKLYSEKYPMFDFYEETRLILQDGRDLLMAHGSSAYSLLKCWPSVVISCILRDMEGKNALYNTLKTELSPFQQAPFSKARTQNKL